MKKAFKRNICVHKEKKLDMLYRRKRRNLPLTRVFGMALYKRSKRIWLRVKWKVEGKVRQGQGEQGAVQF